MAVLTELWLPILLSAVFVFIASSVIHMVIPIHKGDFKKLANEDKVLEAMRAQGVTPGDYMFPCVSSMKEMASPEMIEKCKQGPVGSMTVRPSGVPGMGGALLQWFLYSLLISVFVGYIADLGLSRGEAYMPVFRLTSAAGVLGYAFSQVSDSIWKGLSWSTSLKFVFDGVVYGLVTGGTFGWLWPDM